METVRISIKNLLCYIENGVASQTQNRRWSNRVEFTVKLPNLNFKASNGEALNEALNEALTENQKLLLDILRNNSAVTQKQVIENTALSRSTVQRVMKELTAQGYIERVGSKKFGSCVGDIFLILWNYIDY